METNDFHKQAALYALKEMLEGDSFSICTMREALVITGGSMSSKDEAAMRLMHCKKWKDMPAELRQMLFAKIMEVLSDQPSFNTELLSAALDGRYTSSGCRLLN